MKYIILVSHGEFASGLANALSMLAGNRPDLLCAGLKDGTSAEQFAKSFEDLIKGLGEDDEILLFGDLIGGSPLTTACNVLCEKGFGPRTKVVGGMNLPAVLSALLVKDAMDLDALKESAISEGSGALKEMVLVDDDDEGDDI